MAFVGGGLCCLSASVYI